MTSVEAYDPASNAWSTKAPLPTPRLGLAFVNGGDGKLYALGGYGGSGTTTVEAYDPATDTWTTKASMLTGRWNLGATLGPDGLVYAIGGSAPSGGGEQSVAEAYDPRD